MHTTPLPALCSPEEGHLTRLLQRPYFGMRRFDSPGSGGVEVGLSYGAWIHVLRHPGLEIEALVEVQRKPA